MISEAIDTEYKIDWIRATPEPSTITLGLITLIFITGIRFLKAI